MEFIIEMRKICPDFKVHTIHAKNISQAQEFMLTLITEYTQIGKYGYKIRPLLMNADIRDFRITYKRQSYRIRLYPAQ